MTLNLNFSTQLFFHLVFLQFWFVQDFQGDNVTTSTFSCQIDVTKFPFAQGSSNVKVFEGPAHSVKLCYKSEKSKRSEADPSSCVEEAFDCRKIKFRSRLTANNSGKLTAPVEGAAACEFLGFVESDAVSGFTGSCWFSLFAATVDSFILKSRKLNLWRFVT